MFSCQHITQKYFLSTLLCAQKHTIPTIKGAREEEEGVAEEKWAEKENKGNESKHANARAHGVSEEIIPPC